MRRRPVIPTFVGLIRVALALATAGSLVAGCSSGKPDEHPPRVTIEVATATVTSISRLVDADAIVFPHDQAAIVPKISAPVKKFYVDRGTHVHTGQLLAELESKDLAGTYAENQGGYDQAQAMYETALQKATQDSVLAKQQLDEAQRIYDGRRHLLEQGAISAKDLEDAQINLTQAQNQFELAQKQYDLKAATGQLRAAKGRTASAEAQLDYTRITSPITGVVTDRPLYEGETASNGTPLLTIMDISRVIVKAHIAMKQATALKRDDPVAISSEGIDQPINGSVTLVSPALDPNSTTVEVWIQAANPKERLKPGASVRVRIAANTDSHALVIPQSALLTDPDGKTSVFILATDNKPVKRSVKTAIRNDEQVQITEGLKEGDTVVTTGAFELSNLAPEALAKITAQVRESQPAGDDNSKDNQ